MVASVNGASVIDEYCPIDIVVNNRYLVTDQLALFGSRDGRLIGVLKAALSFQCRRGLIGDVAIYGAIWYGIVRDNFRFARDLECAI